FFSRARWSERVGALLLIIGALLATSRVVHESIANGMMGMMLTVYAVPALSLALVVWAAVSQRFTDGLRRVSLVIAILLACSVFMLLRTGGMTGDADSDLHWRWTQTPEQRLLAADRDEPKAPTPMPAAATSPTPGSPLTASPSPDPLKPGAS